MIPTLLFVAFIVMLLLGVPIGAALGLAGAGADWGAAACEVPASGVPGSGTGDSSGNPLEGRAVNAGAVGTGAVGAVARGQRAPEGSGARKDGGSHD